MRLIQPNLYHTISVIFHGNNACIDKFLEEIQELDEALTMYKAGECSKDHMIQELADVEVTIPYILKAYMSGISMEMSTPIMSVDYHDACELIGTVVRFRKKYGEVKILRNLLFQAMILFKMSVSELYIIHSIEDKEVESWRKEKMRRTLKRIAGRVTGGNT